MSPTAEEAIPQRCVRRRSPRLNRGKASDLHALVDAYAKEKDDHLRALGPAVFAGFSGDHAYRDHLLHKPGGYTSPYGLQARMWKMALKDAYETMSKFWAAIAEDLKPLVYRKTKWTEEMRHYAFWLLYSPRRVAALYAGDSPMPSTFKVPKSERSAVVKIIAREVRRSVKRLPRVRKARSAGFDANMYTIETIPTGRQQIALMGLTRAKRIRVPLLGTGAVSGNIRLVLEPGTHVAAIHTTSDLKPTKEIPAGEDAAVDIGQSEVITDHRGKRYGQDFGSFLDRASTIDLDKGRRRAKLHAVRKKALAKGNRAKARRIKVNNLGYKKMDARRGRHRAECARQVNTAFNEFLKLRRPIRFAQEKLDFRGKAKSRAMSRRTVQMRNSTINERSSFKASAGGSCRQRINPAYSSQTCPQCGYVHAGNRNGDKFVCLFCGWVGHSDRVGAHNLRNRMDDPDIALWMPKDRVRTILLNRFSQRTGETPDWKPKGDCSGVDSRHQVTTAGRAVGAETQVEGDGSMVRPVAVIDHPGQPESETAKEILAGGTTRPAARYDAVAERGKTVAKRTRS
ncbi:MAG: zinc ribbon domain-containing protein [Acidimicrobiales bacterium]